MKPAAKRIIFKASAFFMLFALLASVLYVSSRVTAPDLVPVSAFGAGLITASAAAFIIFKKRDIRKLTEALDRASIGDFGYRIRDARGIPEDLAEAFNRMARRAERRFKALQAQLETLHQEVSSQEGWRDRCAELEKRLADSGRDGGGTVLSKGAEKGAAGGQVTGLFNRRQIEHILLREMKNSERFKRRASVLMAGLDSFDSYNESHGARAGERLIKGVASALKNGLREVDAIGGLGGGEFIIMLPETSREDAAATAERVRLAVKASCPLTASVGAATYPDDSSTLGGLLEKAEAALKASRKEGGDRAAAAGRKARVRAA